MLGNCLIRNLNHQHFIEVNLIRLLMIHHLMQVAEHVVAVVDFVVVRAAADANQYTLFAHLSFVVSLGELRGRQYSW